MRALAALLAVCCVGCARPKSDVVLAEVSSPLPARVRSSDFVRPRSCLKEANPAAVAKCFFAASEHAGCVYLEVGDTSPSSQLPQGENHCTVVALSRAVALLQEAPESSAFLAADPTQGRLFTEVDGTCRVSFVASGVVLVTDEINCAVRTGTTVDWALVPTLLRHLDALKFEVDGARLDALLAASTDGQMELRESMRNTLFLTAPGWEPAWDRLSPALRREVRNDILESMVNGGGAEAAWFQRHPDQKDERWAERVLEAAVEGATLSLPGFLDELERTRPGAVAERACITLGRTWASTSAAFSERLDVDTIAAPLWALVTLHAKCPWVPLLFEHLRCGAAMGCPGDDGAWKPCTPDEHRAVLARARRELTFGGEETNAAPDAPENEVDSNATLGGQLLLEAMTLNGGVPADFEKRYRRAGYALDEASASLAFDFDDGTGQAMNRELVCRLPWALTRLETPSLRITIDDAHRSLHLEGFADE